MPEISLRDVMVSFGGPPLLEHVDFVVDAGERIGLLGRNGAGKSTLLHVLTGAIVPDAGEVIRRQGVRVGALPQNVPRDLAGSVFEYLYSALAADGLEEWEIEKRIDQALGILRLQANENVEQLSAGLKRRVLLARTLAQEPDVLLLDEPTNHLDLDVIESLEEYLLRRSGALVFVTHDRRFLQRLATRILDVDRGNVRSFACDYRSYVERKEALLEAEAKANADFDKKLAKEEVWVRRGVKARLTRNQGRVRALEAMRAQRRARREFTGNISVQVQEAERSGQLVIDVEEMSYSPSTAPLIQDFTSLISYGDRIGIVGPNGCGKTTLLKLLLKQIKPQQGLVRHGTRLEIAQFDQLHNTLDDTKTAQENICEKGNMVTVGGNSRHIIGYLGDFLFTPEQVRRSIQNLSGGERNRLQLAKLLARPCNLLILDEPTNDLDLETLELLENLLIEYKGTLIVVSHDREFLDNVVTSLLVFEGPGNLREFVGGYEDWQRQRGTKNKTAANVISEKKPEKKIEKSRRLSYQEKRELDSLPSLIDDLEKKKSACLEKMAKPEFYKQDGTEIATTTARLKELEEKLKTAYARWETLEAIANNAN